MKGFSSKLIIALLCCLAALSFVSGQTLNQDDKSISLRGSNGDSLEVIVNNVEVEEEERLLKKVNNYF
jgi:hypothetical protein